MLPQNPFLNVQAVWPVIQDEVFDPSGPNPWSGVPKVASPDPLRPTIYILFTHTVDPAAVANDAAISSYFFLTSLTDPSEPNITQFEAVTWNGASNLLTFRPTNQLTPGASYQATIRGNLKDSAGRKIAHPYSWDFQIDPGLYQGLPVPQLMAPADQSVVLSAYFPMVWGFDPSYVVPSGHTLYFDLVLYSDQDLAQLYWSSSTMAGTAAIPASGTALNLYEMRPSFAPSGLISPASYWWAVRARLVDVSGNVIRTSAYSSPFQFYIDNRENAPDTPASNPGQETYPGLLQANPLSPPQRFMVTGILPSPGNVVRLRQPSALPLDFLSGSPL